MSTIGNNPTRAATTANKVSTTRKPTQVGGSCSPPSKTKGDPSSTAHTINKLAKPDPGKLEFGNKHYPVALIKEVNDLRANPKKYAEVLSAHVRSNPGKFKLADSKFMESLNETIKTLRKKGGELEAGTLSLSKLNYNSGRCKIAKEGMHLLAARGLEQIATQGGDGGVNTRNSDFLNDFIDHEPIEYLRKGGTDKNGKTVQGSDDALNALKKKSDKNTMLHATDLENLHASTLDSVTVRDVIAGWLIDHDVPTKGHRNALLNSAVTEIGVGTSTATVVEKTGQKVIVKMTGLNFYGIYDFSTSTLIEKPPTK